MAGRYRPNRPSVGRTEQGLERGQATVELALSLPFVMLLMLALVQVLLICVRQIEVVNATREGTRRAIVTRDNEAVTWSVERTLRKRGTLVYIDRGVAPGTDVVVRVKHTMSTEVPLVGAMLPDIELSSTAVGRQES